MMRFVGAMVLCLAASLATGCKGNNQNDNRLSGAGSSFINPIMTKWARQYHKEKNIEVNYQSVGSGAGIQQMTKKTVNFGCSDAPMNDEQLQEAREAGGEVVHIPLVMGGVVPAYNLPGVDRPINFTGEVLADIFLGTITKWDDKAIEKLNPGTNLPHKDILVIHRSDPSGTTYIFLDYLAKKSKAWRQQFPKPKTSIEWPVGEGAKGSEGIAGTLSKSQYTLSYVELNYALEKKAIQYGAVKNAAGKFIRADLKSVTKAAQGAAGKIPPDLRYSLTDAPGPGAYPICGTTWAILYVSQPDGVGQQVVQFLRWTTHEGQRDCDALNYAQLPEELVKRIATKLDGVKFSK